MRLLNEKSAGTIETLCKVAAGQGIDAHAAAAGWRIINVDATINAQRPKMAPHITQMIVRIADDLRLAESFVNVKAKTAERLGFVGREEGISCDAVVLIENC